MDHSGLQAIWGLCEHSFRVRDRIPHTIFDAPIPMVNPTLNGKNPPYDPTCIYWSIFLFIVVIWGDLYIKQNEGFNKI